MICPLSDLAVIVPIRPGESHLTGLIYQLKKLPVESELILVFSRKNQYLPEPEELLFDGLANEILHHDISRIELDTDRIIPALDILGDRRIIIIISPLGRATAMNVGSKYTEKSFLWFLHVDSRFTPDTIPFLEKSLGQDPEKMWFFRLTFMDERASRLVQVNQNVARIRSESWGIPFGDQGFCLKRELFFKAGRFPEDIKMGEDHIFLWQVKHAGISVDCTGAELLTSARKYHIHGWLYITLKYQYIWIKQAIPQYISLLRKRNRK